MSLKKDDWKTVLNQPKNLGLKAGEGTGMGKVLDSLEGAERAYREQKTVAHLGDLECALRAVQTQCDAVIRKHEKLFTTACSYLKTVKREAGERLNELKAEGEEMRERAFEERRLGGLKDAIRELCTDAKLAIQNGRTREALEHAVPRLEHASKDFPKARTAVNNLKSFKPNQNGNIPHQYIRMFDAILQSL